MAHVLAKLEGVRLADVRQQLEKDAAGHAEQGMYLEHLWQNAEDASEVLFLFRVNDLDRCRQHMKKIHIQALQKNPGVQLPQVTFLNSV
jgi:hypothetical protein